ncbi:MAG: hypothetical protein GX442_23875 [Candidatus Riflebacteria bacterium]|nr:hypothetical protein [Candidatus Riflebacteria bacterium]
MLKIGFAGLLLSDVGKAQEDEVVKAFEDAIERSPAADRGQAVHELVGFLEERGRLQEAVDCLAAEVLRYPKDREMALVFARMSILFRRRGNIQDADGALETARKYDPALQIPDAWFRHSAEAGLPPASGPASE